MIRAVVTSANPVKIQAVKRVFEDSFAGEITVISQPSDSEVSSQPLSDLETRKGAENRIKKILDETGNEDYLVSIEGGVDLESGHVFSWIIIRSGDTENAVRTASFPLPHDLLTLIRSGTELSEACDRLYDRKDTGRKDGVVGLLTKGRINRQSYYEHALTLALIPFIKR